LGKAFPWIPNMDDETVSEMLGEIGVKDLKELFKDIPRSLFLKEPPRIGLVTPLSEQEAYIHTVNLLKRNRIPRISLLGGGVWNHYIPAAVKEIVRRGEFYTSYTPYQPELSQGLSQALFEYQSMIAELTGMDVVNASMYDWSTAVAEAVLMSVRVTRRKKILFPLNANPMHLRVLNTYVDPLGIEVECVAYNKLTGQLDLNELEEKMDKDTAAVYVQNPSFFGTIETEVDEISNIVHKHGGLLIVGVEPISLGLFKPPGDYGADIVVGEGQPLGLGLNFGGPLLGIFAVRWDTKLVRQMPGRIFGVTRTKDGKERGFIMVLQTREQHIRREKATSNICTNEALCAIAAAVYLALLGPQGIKELAENIFYKTYYLMRQLGKIEHVESPVFKAPHFKDFVARFNGVPLKYLNKMLLEKGIQGGIILEGQDPLLKQCMLLSVTEVLTKRDLDLVVNSLKEILGEED